MYRNAYFINKEMPLLEDKSHDIIGINPICGTNQKTVLENFNCKQSVFVARKPRKCVKIFDEVGSAGTEVMYRGTEVMYRGTEVMYRRLDCKHCENCKKSQKIDAMSIQEEMEQYPINRSVVVNTEKCKTIAKLSFVTDPDFRLRPNGKIAHKI